MTNVIEHQDALVAALWAKTYGYSVSRDNEQFIHAWELGANEAYGVRPHWHVWVHEDDSKDDEMTRDSNYLWHV